MTQGKPMQKLTLQEFSQAGWEFLASLARWWVQVASTQDAKPLFEFKCGSLFVFENKTLPRTGWKKFVLMSLEKKREFLATSPVCVLTIENDDTFLVKMSQDFTDDGGEHDEK